LAREPLHPIGAMPSWLVENPTPVYLILGAAALLSLVAWWITRKRKFLIGAGIAVILIGVVWLIDFLVVTDGERIVLNVKDMAAAVQAKDVDRIFKHVSEKFHSPAGKNKQEFRKTAEDYIRSGRVQEVAVWDFEQKEVSREKRTATVLFMVKARGEKLASGEDLPYRCTATFRLEPDDQWRMEKFEISDPYTTEKIQVPF
jgi:LPXTG-motif cell wall-anchored protein